MGGIRLLLLPLDNSIRGGLTLRQTFAMLVSAETHLRGDFFVSKNLILVGTAPTFIVSGAKPRLRVSATARR